MIFSLLLIKQCCIIRSGMIFSGKKLKLIMLIGTYWSNILMIIKRNTKLLYNMARSHNILKLFINWIKPIPINMTIISLITMILIVIWQGTILPVPPLNFLWRKRDVSFNRLEIWLPISFFRISLKIKNKL